LALSIQAFTELNGPLFPVAAIYEHFEMMGTPQARYPHDELWRCRQLFMFGIERLDLFTDIPYKPA
jgi:hypothetical protein